MRVTRLRKTAAVRAEFAEPEAALLIELCRQLVELLTEHASTDARDHAHDTVDPALVRLLPDAYPDDPEASAEFRHYTESDLVARKARNAQTVLTTLTGHAPAEPEDPTAMPGDPPVATAPAFPDGSNPADGESLGPRIVELDPGDATAWLRTITDVRLTLAVRLGIEKDEDTGRQDAEGRRLRAVYDWLAFVQESLVRAL